MISVSTNPIHLNLSPNDFEIFFSDIEKLRPLFNGKKLVPLQGTSSQIEFLLKRVAVFSLEIDKEREDHYLQLKNTKRMAFQTVMRFEYLPNSKSMAIHFETDTNIFMELFLEKRIKNLVEQVVLNLQKQFNIK